MPELPEVETIKSGLEEYVVGKKITDVDFLWEGILKDMSASDFRKIIVGKKIIGAERRAKNLYLTLDDGLYLLMHMKMTGHLILADDSWEVDQAGRWIKKEGEDSPLYDPLNQSIRAIFSLDDGKILAFSDIRKFAYLKLLDQDGINATLSTYGPEPFSDAFTVEYLGEIFKNKNVAIKKVLMDQAKIAGVGNIYADEILFASKVHPLTTASKLDNDEIEAIYNNTLKILKDAVKRRGTSTSDFRDIEGKKGKFGAELSVYRRTGLPCPHDGTPIKRIVVGGRGTHFCPKEQIQK